MKRNFQAELEKIISDNRKNGIRPKLLLHGCCAPCSSYCLKYLSEFFDITLFYYNPNISPADEYEKRLAEAERLTRELEAPGRIDFVGGKYEPERFFEVSKGLEQCNEGGERCERCFYLRLSEAAAYAKENGFDYFSTTLTISPLKNAELLNRIGEKASREHNIRWLPCDFKKKNGYLQSIELSRKYNLYRQNYCGCVFSKAESELREKNKKELYHKEK